MHQDRFRTFDGKKPDSIDPLSAADEVQDTWLPVAGLAPQAGGTGDVGLWGHRMPPPPADLLRRCAEGDDPLGGHPAPSGVADVLRRSAGTGHRLPEPLGSRLGAHFGRDFSAVRLHSDSESDTLARSVQAVAFTHGQDVYFSNRSYAPGSSTGRHLLAHELAHVAAGLDGQVSATVIGRADDPAEKAADLAADAAMAGMALGEPAAPSVGSASAGASVDAGEPIARTIRRNMVKSLAKGVQKRLGLGGAGPSAAAAAPAAAVPAVTPWAASSGPSGGSAEAAPKQPGGHRAAPAAARANGPAPVAPAKSRRPKSGGRTGGSSKTPHKPGRRRRAPQQLDGGDGPTAGPLPTDAAAVGGQLPAAPAGYPPMGSLLSFGDEEPEASEVGGGRFPASPQGSAPVGSEVSVGEEEPEAAVVGGQLPAAPAGYPPMGSLLSLGEEDENASEDGDLLIHDDAEQAAAPAPGPRKNRAFLKGEVGAAYSGETALLGHEIKGAIEAQWEWLPKLKKCIEALKSGTTPKAAADAHLKGYQSYETIAALQPVDANAALRILQREVRAKMELARLQDIRLRSTGELRSINGRKVHYDSAEEQAKSLVTVKAGRLVRCGGEPVDTAGSSTFLSGKGAEIFVTATNGDIHMGSHKIGKYHHSSLLAASAVAVGGEMKVTAGSIGWVSNKSGHYKPTKDHLVQFLHWLEKRGVDLGFEVKGGWGIPDGKTAAELVEGVKSTGAADVKEGYFQVKLKAVIQFYLKRHSKDDIREAAEQAGLDLDKELRPLLPEEAKQVIAVLKEKFGPAEAVDKLQ